MKFVTIQHLKHLKRKDFEKCTFNKYHEIYIRVHLQPPLFPVIALNRLFDFT